MRLNSIEFRETPPQNQYSLWIKAGIGNRNKILIYDGGWIEIGDTCTSTILIEGNGITVKDTIEGYQISLSEEFYKDYENLIGRVEKLEKGGTSITVDSELSDTSENPVQNKVVTSYIKKLNSEVFPLSLSVRGGGLYKKGTIQTVTVSWTIKQGSDTVIPDKLYVNNVEQDTSKTSLSFTNVNVDTVYTVKIEKDSQTKSGSVKAEFVNPSYIQAVDASFEVNAENIMKLKEVIKDTKSYTFTGSISNQLILYAYPRTFGALVSIKDGNNFENISAYNRQELQINGEQYYCYIMADPVTATGIKQIYS